MGKKTWAEKFETPSAPEVLTMEKPRMKMPAGARMLIPTPREIDAWVRTIPAGERRTVAELRQALAERHGADVTCSLTTGIFLRIVAELALEKLDQGGQDVTPFWRVLDPQSPLAKKLPGGPERLRALQNQFQ